MNFSTYSAMGSLLFYGGIALTLFAVALCFFGIQGVSISSDDELHLHDTFYVTFSGAQWLVFLLPILAGALLMISGYQIRKQVTLLEGDASEFFGMEETRDQ